MVLKGRKMRRFIYILNSVHQSPSSVFCIGGISSPRPKQDSGWYITAFCSSRVTCDADTVLRQRGCEVIKQTGVLGTFVKVGITCQHFFLELNVNVNRR